MIRLSLIARRGAYQIGYELLRAYSLIRHPSLTGVKCVLRDGERVLLVRHTYGRPGWSLPGGLLGRGEIEVAVDGRRDRVHCFGGEASAEAIRPNAAEIAEARWWPPDRLPS